MAEPPSGFEIIYEGSEPNLDIIAVHGIGADRDKTWKVRGFSWLSENDMLPDAFPNARIMSYGYSSSWLGKESISTSLYAVANRFLLLTRELRNRCPERRVIFIAHCFGGIVIEKALLQALANNEDGDRSLVASIAGMVFLGTPHRGSASAGLASIVATVAAFLGHGHSSKILETTNRDSQMLVDTVRQFAVMAFNHNLRIHCFHEEKETDIAAVVRPLIVGFIKVTKNTMLVDRDSACLQGHGETALTADHFRLNKFTCPGDANYLLVKNVLLDFATHADNLLDKDVIQCMKELYVGDPSYHIDDVEHMLGNMLPEQLQDVTKHPDFEHWRDHDPCRVLHINGGTKSERARQMVGIQRQLSSSSMSGLVAYYHCVIGKRDNAACIVRSLVWTLIFNFHPLGRFLKEYIRPGKNFAEDMQRPDVLPKLLHNMLQLPGIPTVYLLIGALDECKGGKEGLLRLMEKTVMDGSSKVKWAISSPSDDQLSLRHAERTARIKLDDPTTSSASSMFRDDRWVERDSMRCYRIRASSTIYTIEQARAALSILVPKQELNDSDIDIRMIPTIDESKVSSSALMTTNMVFDFLANLEYNPCKILRVEVRGVELTFDRHFFGFTQLYANTPTETINLDIIAIPDLNRHAYLSWRGLDYLQTWLRDFLDNDLPRCRVLTFGYASQFSTYGPAAMEKYREDLLEELRKVRHTAEEVRRPLILVGHGFGAILAAQVLAKAASYVGNEDPALGQLYRSLKALILFAAPDRRMLIDTFQSMATATKASDLNPDVVAAINDGLHDMTKYLSKFDTLVKDRKIINVLSSATVTPSASSWSLSRQFVDVDLPILDLPESIESSIQVDSDLDSIARFETSEDSVYQTVLGFLGDWEKTAIKERGAEWVNAATVQPSGFSVIHDPANAIADIVLIPGIEGDPWETWSPSCRSWSHPATLGKFWPASLSNEKRLPAARVLVWGFKLDPTVHIDALLGKAVQLFDDLTNVRPRGRSILFVAQSLGGILLKETLRLASEADTIEAKDIMSYTAAVIFLGTPNQDDGDALSYCDVIRCVVAAHLKRPIEEIQFATQNTAQLETCRKTFIDQRKTYDIRIKSFAEIPIQRIASGAQGQQPMYVVPKIAATLGGLDLQLGSIRPNSAGFCRFQDVSDQGYRELVREFAFSLEQIKRRELHLRDHCLQSLHFKELQSRESDIITGLDKTGTWLFEHTDYMDWVQWDVPKSQNRRGLLWLRGKPGSGKSTLMKGALNRARNMGLKSSVAVAGFFFTRRSNILLQRSLLGMFMTLLHQLIEQDKALLIAFIPVYKRKAAANPGTWTWHQDELRDFFKSAYLGQYPGVENAMIFIDALDESHREGDKTAYQVSYELVHFFRDVTGEDKLKICLSSRYYPDIKVPDCPQISTEDFNGGDITLFVTNMLLGAKIDISMDNMAKRIAKKASGVFLWVILVVGRLNMSINNLAVKKDLEEILTNVPEELEDLFKSLFTGSDSSPTTGIQTTVAIFQWILLAERPLEKDELRQALMISREKLETFNYGSSWSTSMDCMPEDPENFRTSLRFYTRGLAEIVLRRPEIESVHESVREIVRETVRKREQEREPKREREKDLERELEEEEEWERKNWMGTVNANLEANDRRRLLYENIWKEGTEKRAIERKRRRRRIRTEKRAIERKRRRRRIRTETERENYLQIPDNPYKPGMAIHPGPSGQHLENVFEWTPKETERSEHQSLMEDFERRLRSEDLHLDGELMESHERHPVVHPSKLPVIQPIQFIHESVREFFLNGPGFAILEKPQAIPSSVDKHEILAEYCMACITQTLQLQFAADQIREKEPFLVYAAQSLFYHVHQVERNGRVPERVIRALADQRCWEKWKALQVQLGISPRGGIFSTPGYALLHHLCLKRLFLSASTLFQEGDDVNVQSRAGDSALHYVAQEGDVDAVFFLIQNRADTRVRNVKGETPLHLAVKFKASESVTDKLLKPFLDDLHYGAVEDTDVGGHTPLHEAVRCGNAVAVQLLLSHGASINAGTASGITPLHLAVKGDHETIATALLTAGANVNVTDVMREAPIHCAAIKSNASLMHSLVQHGANVNALGASGITPLHLRILQDLGIRYLIEKGANIEARTIVDQQTALHLVASRHASTGNLATLIAAGADQSATDWSKRTALHYAAETASPSVVKQLLQGRNGDSALVISDRYLRTPLHYAAQRPNLEVFRLLVEAGADLTVKDSSQITPVDHAGNRILDDPYLQHLIESKGYRKTLKRINGQLTTVFSLP